MPIVFRCPACGRDLEAPDAAYNAAGSCRFCGAQIVSPSESGAPATLIAPGPAAAYAPVDDVTQPTGRVNPLEILGEAWELYQRNLGLFLGSVFVFALIQYGTGQVVNRVFSGGGRASEIVGGLMGALLAPLAAGPLYMFTRALAGRQFTFWHLFQGFSHAFPLIAGSILLGIPWFAAMAWIPAPPAAMTTGTPNSEAVVAWFTAILPRFGIAVVMIALIMVPVSLTTMEIVDRGCGPIDAIRKSLEATRGSYLAILATRVLLGLVGMAGILLCCVGVFATMPITFAGEVLIYRHLRGLRGTPD